MKILITSFLFCLTPLLLLAAGNTAVLNVKVADCRMAGLDRQDLSDSHLEIRNSKGIVVWSYKTCGNRYDDEVQITMLTPGVYTATYINNLFNKMTEFLTLKPGANELSICVSRVPSYTHHTLAGLKEGRSLYIGFVEIGCFGYSMCELNISRKNKQLVATLTNVAPDEDAYGRKPGKGKRYLVSRQLLDTTGQRAFIEFENELRYTGELGCTTTDYYTIRSPYWNGDYKDGNCSWSGFTVLALKIFKGINEDFWIIDDKND